MYIDVILVKVVMALQIQWRKNAFIMPMTTALA